MSDIKLFRVKGGTFGKLESSSARVERSLQTQFEVNLDALLGVRFLKTEFTFPGGRIDTLGIDENNCPVIIEYKRQQDDNVITQGLFYLDWLMNHRGDFEILVRDHLDENIGQQTDWSAPRLICIAANFSRYDVHAVNQIDRNIELVRYRKFGDDLLLLELLTVVSTTQSVSSVDSTVDTSKKKEWKTVSESLKDASPELKNLYSDVETFMMELGDDVTQKTLLYYVAFRRMKNFASVEVRARDAKLLISLKLNPAKEELEEGFARDVRNIGHLGTGDLEVTLKSHADLERAKPLIRKSYEES